MEKRDVIIRIDAKMHKLAKAKAERNGQSVRGYVSKLIEKDTAGEVTQPTETTTQTTTRDAKAK